MSGALLRSGTLKELNPLGAVGNPVYAAASQLRAAMRRQLGQDVADLFAIPKQNEEGNVIDWYAPYPGDVIPWSAATADERRRAKETLLAARTSLAEKSSTLQAHESTEQQVFGRLLAEATQIPNDSHVYLVDGRPVMTFWGFTEQNAPADRDVLANLFVGEDATPMPPPAAATVPVEPVQPAQEPARRRFLGLPWWAWLLLLLLLLALLLFGLSQCRDEAARLGIPFVEAPREETPPAEPGDEVPLDEQGRPLVIPEGGRRLDDGRVVPGDEALVVPGGDVVPDAETAPGDDVAPGEPPLAEDAAETPGEEPALPEEEAPPLPDGAAEEPAEQPGEEPVEPPLPEQATEQPPTPPAPEDVVPADRQTPPPGLPLEIPEEAGQSGDTDFLNGTWQSNTGLVDDTGRPVDLQYTFEDGQGRATLRRDDGSTCSGPMQARMQDGRLVMQHGALRCPDGSEFKGSTVECTPDASGRAECEGRYPNGNRYPVDISKESGG